MLKNMLAKFRKGKNNFLLKCGFVLKNKHNHFVYLENGVQKRTNQKRLTPYSLDDESWSIASPQDLDTAIQKKLEEFEQNTKKLEAHNKQIRDELENIKRRLECSSQ